MQSAPMQSQPMQPSPVQSSPMQAPMQSPATQPPQSAVQAAPLGLGATPKVAWIVLGLGALLALLGTAALVVAILLR